MKMKKHQTTCIDIKITTIRKKKIELKKDFEWFLSEEFQRLREGFIPTGRSNYEDKDNENVESVKKNSPHIQQKILSEEVDESSSQSLEEEQPAMLTSSSSSSSSSLPYFYIVI